MKNIVKSSKHFFGYFNTLEIHSEMDLICELHKTGTENQKSWSMIYIPDWEILPPNTNHGETRLKRYALEYNFSKPWKEAMEEIDQLKVA